MHLGHDISADYWSLGILVFEMLVGNPPFSSQREEKTYSLAQRGIDKIDWPRAVNSRAEGLIRKLCHQNPSKRIGNQRNGLNDVRNHAWFEGFDWSKMKQREMESPHRPEIRASDDTKNFDDFDEDFEHVKAENSGWDRDF